MWNLFRMNASEKKNSGNFRAFLSPVNMSTTVDAENNNNICENAMIKNMIELFTNFFYVVASKLIATHAEAFVHLYNTYIYCGVRTIISLVLLRKDILHKV